MKKMLSVICAFFVAVAFACVTLAVAADNVVKPTPTDNAAKAPEKKAEPKPAEKK